MDRSRAFAITAYSRASHVNPGHGWEHNYYRSWSASNASELALPRDTQGQGHKRKVGRGAEDKPHSVSFVFLSHVGVVYDEDLVQNPQFLSSLIAFRATTRGAPTAS